MPQTPQQAAEQDARAKAYTKANASQPAPKAQQDYMPHDYGTDFFAKALATPKSHNSNDPDTLSKILGN